MGKKKYYGKGTQTDNLMGGSSPLTPQKFGKKGGGQKAERRNQLAKQIRENYGDMNLIKKPSEKEEEKQVKKPKLTKKKKKKSPKTRLGKGMKVSSKTAIEGLLGRGTVGW